MVQTISIVFPKTTTTLIILFFQKQFLEFCFMLITENSGFKETNCNRIDDFFADIQSLLDCDYFLCMF